MDGAREALVFDLKDPVSKVIARMYAENASEVTVFDGKSYIGVLSSDKLIKKNISEPDKIKLLNLKSSIDRIEPFEGADPQEIIKSVLVNNYKSAPVKENGKLFFLKKLEMLKFAKESIKNKKAADVMIFPYVVSASDSFDVAKSILRDSGSNRLVVLEKDKVVGILHPLDILHLITSKSRSEGGVLTGEKIDLGKILVSSKSVMQEDFLRAAPDTKLSDLVKQMSDKNKDTIIVEEKGKLVGLVTPRHILKLAGQEVGGVYVQITGIQDEDMFIKSIVDDEIAHEIRKLAKVAHIDYMTLHVSKYNEKGSRVKYSVHGKLITSVGMFFAQDFAWDLTQAVRGLLKKMEKELLKKRGKIEHSDRTDKRFRNR